MNSLKTSRRYNDTLLGLLKRYSPSGQESEAAQWLVDHMITLGYDDAKTDDVGNAVGQVGSGPIHIVLLGHIDTVPGETKVRAEGDLVYGRGAVDAKGPLAAFTAAALTGASHSNLTITVIGAVREETDSAGAIFVRDEYRSPDYLIIGEPSRWDQIAVGYKGSAWYDLTVERFIAHTATNEQTASELSLDAWQHLHSWSEAYNSSRPKLFDQLGATLCAMQSHSDGLVDQARLRVGFRLPEDIAPPELHTKVRQILDQGPVSAKQQDGAVAAYRAAKNTPLVRAALTAIRKQGGKPRFVVKSGTSDMNVLGPIWKCPSIAYGPGDSTLDHTPEEHISLKEFHNTITILSHILEIIANRHT